MPRSKETIRLRLPSGQIVHRVVKDVSFGNFAMRLVKVEGDEYLLEDNGETVNETKDKVYALGKRLGKN